MSPALEQVELLANQAFEQGKVIPTRCTYLRYEPRSVKLCGCALGAATYMKTGCQCIESIGVMKSLGVTSDEMAGVIDGFDGREYCFEPERSDIVAAYNLGKRLADKWLPKQGSE